VSTARSGGGSGRKRTPAVRRKTRAATGSATPGPTRRRAVGGARVTAGPEKWLGMWDIHLPNEEPSAINPTLRYMADERWDGVILGGDLMDLNVISSHNLGFPRRVEGQRFKADLDYTNEWLDGFVKSARKHNPRCRIVYLEGNHEYRVERYLDANPQLEGTMELTERLRLKDRGIEWLRSWSKGEVLTLGHANFAHGDTTTVYHAAKMVKDYGANVFYGHTHDVQEHSMHRKAKGITIKGKSIGCLCRYDPDWMRGRAHRWQHAFGVFYVWKDGIFQEFTVHINGGRFVAPTNGRCYGG
jgi:predicted phosphodiesterase